MQMQPRNAELKALISLQNAISLKAMGCRFDRGLSGGICVTLAGAGVGCWWYENEAYSFARYAGQNPLIVASNVEELVAETANFAHAHFVRSQNLVM